MNKTLAQFITFIGNCFVTTLDRRSLNGCPRPRRSSSCTRLLGVLGHVGGGDSSWEGGIPLGPARLDGGPGEDLQNLEPPGGLLLAGPLDEVDPVLCGDGHAVQVPRHVVCPRHLHHLVHVDTGLEMVLL